MHVKHTSLLKQQQQNQGLSKIMSPQASYRNGGMNKSQQEPLS